MRETSSGLLVGQGTTVITVALYTVITRFYGEPVLHAPGAI